MFSSHGPSLSPFERCYFLRLSIDKAILFLQVDVHVLSDGSA